MGNTLLHQLLANMKWFSIMADETRDISNNEQLAIVIRWVDRCYDIHEDLYWYGPCPRYHICYISYCYIGCINLLRYSTRPM